MLLIKVRRKRLKTERSLCAHLAGIRNDFLFWSPTIIKDCITRKKEVRLKWRPTHIGLIERKDSKRVSRRSSTFNQINWIEGWKKQSFYFNFGSEHGSQRWRFQDRSKINFVWTRKYLENKNVDRIKCFDGEIQKNHYLN